MGRNAISYNVPAYFFGGGILLLERHAGPGAGDVSDHNVGRRWVRVPLGEDAAQATQQRVARFIAL